MRRASILALLALAALFADGGCGDDDAPTQTTVTKRGDPDTQNLDRMIEAQCDPAIPIKSVIVRAGASSGSFDDRYTVICTDGSSHSFIWEAG